MNLCPKAKFWGYNHHVLLFVQTKKCPFWGFLDLNPPVRPTSMPQMWILSIPNEARQFFTPKKVYLIHKMQKINMWDFFQRCVIVSDSVSWSVSYMEIKIGKERLEIWGDYTRPKTIGLHGGQRGLSSAPSLDTGAVNLETKEREMNY